MDDMTSRNDAVAAQSGVAANNGGEETADNGPVTSGEGTPAEPHGHMAQTTTSDAAALHEMRRYLESRVRDLEEETQRLRQRLVDPPVINVTVAAPSTPARLRTFTGRTPSGGNEVSFAEWEVQTEQLLQDKTAGDVEQRIKASLKGLAWEQARNCTSAGDILAKVRSVFGPSQTAEDLYQTFQQQKIQRKEKASAFLLRMWDDLNIINRVTKFTPTELQCKVYRTFLRGLGSTHQLLRLEIRTCFGIPGAVSPDLSELLRTVRQLEESQQEAPPEAQSHTHQVPALSEADLERIITGVTQRLQAQTPFFPPSTPVPAHSHDPGHAPPTSHSDHQHQRRPKGPCYQCGKVGHFARECRSRPASRGKSLNSPQSRVRGGQ